MTDRRRIVVTGLGVVSAIGKTREEFVEMREARDATLSMPKLIVPSIQVNMNAGHLPEPEDNGVAYLKVPLNRL